METRDNAKIIELRQAAYAAQLETVENYLANSVWLDGIGSREVSETLDADIIEELDHAKRLAHRLKQLGVCPPGSVQLLRTLKSLQSPLGSTDLRAVVEGVLEAERDAIACYEQIIRAYEGNDYVTQDIAITPLGVPMLAGPGAISTALILMSQARGWEQQAALFVCIAAVGSLSYLVFRVAVQGARRLSPLALKLVTRLMGLLLAAVAVQFALNGLAQTSLFAR
jgi:bacterioferritin